MLIRVRQRWKIIVKFSQITILTLLFASSLVFSLNVSRVSCAFGKIVIYPDGSLEPSYAPVIRSGNTYTFTDDARQLVIQRSGVTVDSARALA
jgi:hypothetical protein